MVCFFLPGNAFLSHLFLKVLHIGIFSHIKYNKKACGVSMENVNWDQLFYYEDLTAYAKYLASHYPDYVSYTCIGRSYDNRDIFLLKIGRGKKNILLTAGVHGRESINPMVLLSMAEFYCEEWRDYLLTVTIYMVPLVNPDGYVIAVQGFDGIKNGHLKKQALRMNLPFYQWKFNGRGVDINRNFPASSWRRKKTGDYPGSEYETAALMQLMQEIPFIGYIDYHSRGKEIYYYRNALSERYNQEQKRLGELIAALTDYQLLPPSEEIEPGDSGGNTVQYYSEVFKKPAITVETVENEAMFPLSPHYQRVVFEEIKMTPFVLLKNE